VFRQGRSADGTGGHRSPVEHSTDAACRDNAWLALLSLSTDLPYGARGRSRELQPLDLSHDERHASISTTVRSAGLIFRLSRLLPD
jgi:hypothetical protein